MSYITEFNKCFNRYKNLSIEEKKIFLDIKVFTKYNIFSLYNEYYTIIDPSTIAFDLLYTDLENNNFLGLIRTNYKLSPTQMTVLKKVYDIDTLYHDTKYFEFILSELSYNLLEFENLFKNMSYFLNMEIENKDQDLVDFLFLKSCFFNENINIKLLNMVKEIFLHHDVLRYNINDINNCESAIVIIYKSNIINKLVYKVIPINVYLSGDNNIYDYNKQEYRYFIYKKFNDDVIYDLHKEYEYKYKDLDCYYIMRRLNKLTPHEKKIFMNIPIITPYNKLASYLFNNTYKFLSFEIFLESDNKIFGKLLINRELSDVEIDIFKKVYGISNLYIQINNYDNHHLKCEIKIFNHGIDTREYLTLNDNLFNDDYIKFFLVYNLLNLPNLMYNKLIEIFRDNLYEDMNTSYNGTNFINEEQLNLINKSNKYYNEEKIIIKFRYDAHNLKYIYISMYFNKEQCDNDFEVAKLKDTNKYIKEDYFIYKIK